MEIGSGMGINLEICKEKNAQRMIGCDISDKLLNLAQKRLKGISNCEFILIDGENIPLSDQEIDCSFTVTVLQHTSNLEMLEKLTSEQSYKK